MLTYVKKIKKPKGYQINTDKRHNLLMESYNTVFSVKIMLVFNLAKGVRATIFRILVALS